MHAPLAGLQNLIGFHTIARRHESLYAFVARLVRSNLLTDSEVRGLLPRSWILRAFAPDDDEVPNPATDFQVALPSTSECQVEHKVSIDPWILFPSIARASKRRLRGCPNCFESGHHSYAFQDSLLSRCPVHRVPLSDRCPHCATPLWWRHSTIRESSFTCPRGCDLMGGLYAGLDDDDFDRLAKQLDKHVALVNQLRTDAPFVSGLTHISYPPRLADTNHEDTYRPGSGLAGALVSAARPYANHIPALEEHYEQANDSWEIQVQPLEALCEIDQVEQKTRRMMAAFRRGAFRTELPLSSPIDKALLDRLGMHAMLVDYRDAPQISVASYMLTTQEFNALQRILSAGHAAAHTHYDLALRDILDVAVDRHAEREDSSLPREAMATAETVSGLMQTETQVLWIRGHSAKLSEAADVAWASFSELTDDLGGQP